MYIIGVVSKDYFYLLLCVYVGKHYKDEQLILNWLRSTKYSENKTKKKMLKKT